jgi:ribosomal protein S17E
MDLINDIAGYTEKYYEETLDKIDHEGLVKKYRQ